MLAGLETAGRHEDGIPKEGGVAVENQMPVHEYAAVSKNQCRTVPDSEQCLSSKP